jgi:type IV secretion system protein VirB8
MVTQGTLQEYFEKARRFDEDRLALAEHSRRLAWGVALVACLMAIAALLAVAALAPLKTVAPFVVRVDNATGIVDVVDALSQSTGTYDEAVTKYFAAKYVRAREGWAASEAEENFRLVTLMSTPDEQARFAALYRGSNPQSPQNILGRAAVARIQIKAISLINRQVLQVRYLKDVRRTNEDHAVTHWVATLTYAYTNAPTSTNDRLANPLGFLVSDYRSDPEVVQ